MCSPPYEGALVPAGPGLQVASNGGLAFGASLLGKNRVRVRSKDSNEAPASSGAFAFDRRVTARLSFMDVSSHRMTGSLLDALRQQPLFVNGQDQDIGTVGAEIDRLHGQASAQAGRR